MPELQAVRRRSGAYRPTRCRPPRLICEELNPSRARWMGPISAMQIFVSATSSSLRGADLRGAQPNGTDLRETDLSDALLTECPRTKPLGWGAGCHKRARSHAGLHNAGVEAAQAENGLWLRSYSMKLSRPTQMNPSW